MSKIFVQIASYRDPDLINTVEDLITNAKNPQNLKICIAHQYSNDDYFSNDIHKYEGDKRFKILNIPFEESKGACWARNKIQQEYLGEDYTLQIDSHHRFIKNWDEEIINIYKNLQNKGYKKPLLTSYIPSFNPNNDPDERVNVPWKMNFDRFIPEGAIFFLPASIDNHKELTEPIPARFYSAHFAFTTGDFVKEVQHDPEYYFHGEEISIAVRAYTWGYDLFHPHKIIAWHEYTRQGRTKHWDDDKSWGTKNSNSHLRNRKLFEMDGLTKDIDFGIYDFGKVRTLEDYERYAGISFKKRAIQQYTLDNNIAPNPPLYGEDFEKSFLQIFKHCIDLYKESFTETDYDFWAIIFEDETGKTIYRQDLNEQEVADKLQIENQFINIWLTFNTEKKPYKWIVWPHSKSKGWLSKIENKL